MNELARLIIIALVLAGLIAVFCVVAPELGIIIPAFVVKILWIIFVVAAGVLAIKFILSLPSK